MGKELIKLSQATTLETDAQAAAQLIRASDPPYYDFCFGSAAAALSCLEKLWRAPVGSLSHSRFQVWRADGQIAGLASHYPAATDALLSGEDAEAQEQLHGDLAQLQGREALLAWLFPHLPDDVWYLRTLAVSADLRGQGVGARILDEIIHAARTHGARAVHTDVDSGNPGAVRFYQQHGFEIIAEIRVPMLEQYHLPASLRMSKTLI